MPTGHIQVTVAGTVLAEGVQKIIRPALTRHIIELSAAIESAAPHRVMTEKRNEAIQGRRRVDRNGYPHDDASPRCGI
jgi:hypothetical protein